MVAKKARPTPLMLPHERIRKAFVELFAKENIGPEFYRIYVGPSNVPNRYDVTLIWDGFDPMSVTTRQVWLWKRLHRDFSDSMRSILGLVHTYSAREVVVGDDIDARVTYDAFA